MKKAVSRIICLALSIYLTSIVCPGFDLSGNPATSAGVGALLLWVTYAAARIPLLKWQSVDGQANSRSLFQRLMPEIWFVVVTIAYVFTLSYFSVFLISAIYWGIAAGVLIFYSTFLLAYLAEEYLLTRILR